MYTIYKLLFNKENTMTRKDLVFVVKRAAIEIAAIGGIIVLMVTPVIWLMLVGMRSCSTSAW